MSAEEWPKAFERPGGWMRSDGMWIKLTTSRTSARVSCKVCWRKPKFHNWQFHTLDDVNAWWAEHVTSEAHITALRVNELAEQFGATPARSALDSPDPGGPTDGSA